MRQPGAGACATMRRTMLDPNRDPPAAALDGLPLLCSTPAAWAALAAADLRAFLSDHAVC